MFYWTKKMFKSNNQKDMPWGNEAKMEKEVWNDLKIYDCYKSPHPFRYSLFYVFDVLDKLKEVQVVCNLIIESFFHPPSPTNN